MKRGERRPMPERFWAKVSKAGHSKCWEWLSSRDDLGYGMLWYEGRSVRAHRFSWLLANGAIPKGMKVCHSCDNPPCVNPSHLWLGTDADNSLDSVKKGRHVRMMGSEHPMARLDERAVRTIRRLLAVGTKQCDLAKMFRCSQANISRIAMRQTWSHV